MRKGVRSVGGIGMGISLVGVALAWAGPAWSPEASAAEKVVIRLSWKIKGEFAPLYVAVAKGYYAAEGLDVSVEEGAGAPTAMKTVAAGRDQFAYIGGLETAQGVGQGIPLKMVANFIKRMPVGVASHPDIPLSKPKDLEGKRIAAAPADSFTAVLPAFAKMHGLNLDSIKVVVLDFAARMGAFMRRETETITIYLTNDLPVMEDRMGKKLNTLVLSDWGFPLLGHGLVTSDEYIKTNPETIRKVVRATAKGWADTIANPDEAAAIVVKRFPEALKLELTAKQLRIGNTLTASAASKGKPLGYQAQADWEETISTLVATGGIPSAKPLSAYYTTAFVE